MELAELSGMSVRYTLSRFLKHIAPPIQEEHNDTVNLQLGGKADSPALPDILQNLPKAELALAILLLISSSMLTATGRVLPRYIKLSTA